MEIDADAVKVLRDHLAYHAVILDKNATVEQMLLRLLSEHQKLADRWLAIAQAAKESRTGLTIRHVRYVEDGEVMESGYQLLTYHRRSELNESLDDLIDGEIGLGI